MGKGCEAYIIAETKTDKNRKNRYHLKVKREVKMKLINS